MIALASSHVGQLALGLSLLLLVGVVAGWAHRSPVRRHRWAEAVLVSVPVCAVLLAVPMERALLGWTQTSPDIRAPSPVVAPQLDAGQAGQAAGLASGQAPSPAAPTVTVAFAAGAAAFLLYLLCGALLLARLVRGAHELAGRSPGSRVRVLVAGSARRPFCLGTRRWGLIVLPSALAEAGREDVLEAVLAHERAHLEDGHGRARLVAGTLLPILYWNPLYWWLVARMRADAELLADEAAARRLGTPRYVRALLSLVEGSPREPLHALPILGALAPTRPFLVRMETLMLRSQPLDRTVSPAWRAVSLALLLSAVALVNAACGATAPGGHSAAVERLSVPFQTLSLEGTELGEALERGASTEAPFPGRVGALEGRSVVIDGYIIPLQFEGDNVTEFILARDNLECCMGGAPTWGHWLYARTDGSTPVPYMANQRVRVEGDFDLVHPREWSPDGIGMGVYEMSGCSVRPLD